MFEPFGYDTYWKGPEYKVRVEAGIYDIIVSSKTNDGKYSLAIGEAENFDFREIMNALDLVPKIKRDFSMNHRSLLSSRHLDGDLSSLCIFSPSYLDLLTDI
jgi:hypothetical protein